MSSIEPQTIDDLMRTAQIVMRAMAGDSVTPELTAIAMQWCAARGWSVWDAPAMTYILGGRVDWSARGVRRAVLAVATVQVTERTAVRYAMTVTPRGSDVPFEVAVDLEWAKRIGIYRTGKTGKTKWESDPATMLESHGWRMAARRVAVDIGGSDDADSDTPTPAEVAQTTAEVAQSAPYAGATPRFSAPTPAPAPAFDARAARAQIASALKTLAFDRLPSDAQQVYRERFKALDDAALRSLLDAMQADDDVAPALDALCVTAEHRAALTGTPASADLITLMRSALSMCVVHDPAALDAYLGALLDADAQALITALTDDYTTAAGRIPGVTPPPTKGGKQQKEQ